MEFPSPFLLRVGCAIFLYFPNYKKTIPLPLLRRLTLEIWKGRPRSLSTKPKQPQKSLFQQLPGASDSLGQLRSSDTKGITHFYQPTALKYFLYIKLNPSLVSCVSRFKVVINFPFQLSTMIKLGVVLQIENWESLGHSVDPVTLQERYCDHLVQSAIKTIIVLLQVELRLRIQTESVSKSKCATYYLRNEQQSLGC